MSGLNAIEMSSLHTARRPCVYRRAKPGPDCDEPEGAGPAQDHGPGVAGAKVSGGGGSAGGPIGPPDPTDPTQAGAGRRCRPGAWPAGQAFEPAVQGTASPEGSGCLPAAVRRVRSYLCQREASRSRTGREPGHATPLAAARGSVAAATTSGL